MTLFSDDLISHIKERFPLVHIGEIAKPPYPATLAAADAESTLGVEQELKKMNISYIKYHRMGFTIFRPNIKFMSKKQYLKSL